MWVGSTTIKTSPKKFSRTEHSSLFYRIVSEEEKNLYTLTSIGLRWLFNTHGGLGAFNLQLHSIRLHDEELLVTGCRLGVNVVITLFFVIDALN